MPGTLLCTPQLSQALSYVDGALGSLVLKLRNHDLLNSTEIIITAKHSQSPIDTAKLKKIGDPVTAILTKAGIAIGQNTTDDIALVWLKDPR